MFDVMRNRPHFTEQEAARLAIEIFGVEADAHPMPSERDQNFHLRAKSGAEFVLKIASAAEEFEVLDLQNRTMARLGECGIRCPQVLAGVDGARIAETADAQGMRHFVRMLSYIPGVFFATVRPQPPELLRQLGAFFGKMDSALLGFSHPAARRALVWDMRRAGEVVRRCAVHIRESGRKALVEMFLERFETMVVPLLPGLRESVIHNDGNDYNVLVTACAGQPGRREIAGIIDFGDMLYSITAANPAIAAAYALLDKPDPLGAAAHVIGAYHENFPLTEPELAVMFHLVCMRLATSVALSAYQQQQEPENRYLSISEKPAWDALEKLASVHPRLAHYAFRSACKFEPCPRAARVVEWLKGNRSRFGPVVDCDLARDPVVVFDLSIETPFESEVLLPAARPSAGQNQAGNQPYAQAVTDLLFGVMKAAGARAGVGRYNEARLLYTTDQYRVPSNDLPERRTVHIGIDLFMPPGSPVFAPMDGTVHSFRDNAQLLDYGPTIILQHEMGGADGAFFTLYGHLTRTSLDGLDPGMPVRRGDRIAWIGDDPENGGWTPHLHFEIITDLLDREGEFPGVAAPGMRAVWLSLCPDPNWILGIPESLFPAPKLSAGEILERRRSRIGPNLSVSYRKPLHIVRGYMQHLYDAEGHRYLDAVNNVPHVGHSHPRVVRAARRQAGILNTNTRYLHENIVRYAERLCAKLPAPLRVCYFVCSGSEANDLALRLARAHTRRRGMIVLEGAYHGNLTSLIDISPYKFDGQGGSGAPAHVRKAAVPDVYRGLYRKADPDAGSRYGRCVSQEIEAMRGEGHEIAAFISETALSCAGQIILPAGYLAEAFRHVRAAGGVCIADEVQVGFGRLGTHFWGFETQDVVPDIVTMGKPIGNGHPLAAVVTTEEIAASFHNGMEYFNTYGGNPVSCAVGLAVLDVIESEGLQAHALAVGSRMKEGLARLKDRHPFIGDVRGGGLFIGVELVLDRETLEPAPEQAAFVIEQMKDRGILISTDGPLHNVLKIKPPLAFTARDAECLIETLDDIL